MEKLSKIVKRMWTLKIIRNQLHHKISILIDYKSQFYCLRMRFIRNFCHQSTVREIQWQETANSLQVKLKLKYSIHSLKL
jgi:hypothetical protein